MSSPYSPKLSAITKVNSLPKPSKSSLPHLASILLHIGTCAETHEDKYMILLRILHAAFDLILREKIGEPKESLELEMDELLFDWHFDLLAIDLLAEYIPRRQDDTIPALKHVIAELKTLPEWDDADMAELTDEKLFRGLRLKGMMAWALAATENADPRYAAVNEELCRAQPTYYDHPSNIEEYHRIREGQEMIGDLFFDVTQAVVAHVNDQESLDMVLCAFTGIFMLVADLFKETMFNPHEWEVQRQIESYINHLSIDLEDPLTPVPLSVRRTLANVNVRGLMEILVHDARILLRDEPREHLGWWLHAWLVDAIVDGLEDTALVQKVISQQHGWLDFLRPGSYPRPNYIPEGFEYILQNSISLRVDDQNLPVTNDDVELEPCGHELDPLDYSTQVQVVKQDELCAICQEIYGHDSTVSLHLCGHIFHTDCVKGMVNNVHASSNKCPFRCQNEAPICPPRARRPKLE